MKISRNQIRLIKHNGNYTTNDVVKIVIELLNQQGLTWWLDFGQLLSLHRDNKPLDWVDDWDFCIIKKDNKTFNDIFNLIRSLSTNHFVKDDNIIRFNLLGVEFDFYFCQYNEKDKNMRHLNFEEGGCDMPSFFYDRLDKINWNRCSFNVPRHLDHYLLLRYGENWKTPIKKFMGDLKEDIGSLYKKDRYSCLIAGVFDGLHYGHQNLISHGLKYFNEVVIGVHSDESINYKTPPAHNMSDRIKAISDRYPHIKIIENCPLKTDSEYLKTIGCDFVVFGDESSDNIKLFYPDNEVNHPIDRYPILSSNRIRQQTVHSYCINLGDKEYKFINALNELDRLSIYPNRFVVEKNNLTKRILREGVNEKSNQILESHLKLLKHLESIDQPCFIIFEDDIKVIKDIDVDEIISSAPKDWDVIYLGGMNHYHTPKIIDNQFYKCKFSFNAHAFIVKKEFMPKMIEHLEKREYENDVIFAYMQSNGIGNWYGLIDDAIIQDGVDSPTFITTLSDNSFEVINKLKGNFNLSKKEPEIDKFYEFVLMCKGLIPYLSKEIPVIDKKSYKKSLLVETRELEHNGFVIKNTIQKLGDGWGHIIYCHENNYSQIKSICDDISTDIEIRLVEKDLDRNDYNNLLLDINFWNEIDCEKVLIYQTDTFIAKKFDDSFLEFDYIGAPWGPSSHSDFLKNHLNIEIDLLIGNGGLSIRDVEKSKSCLIDGYVANHRNNRTDLTLDEPPEDVIFSLYFYDKKYPSLQRSIDFSCEISLNLDSFGFHKPWNIFNDTYSMTKELKKKFFQKEKKRILFINHEESLTGAPILLKNLIDFEKDTDDFDVWCVSLKNSNGEWDFKQKFYSSDIPGDSDPEKVKYLQEILNPDFVYANTIVTMSFAKNFICDKLISIHEYRSLIPYLSNLKEDLSNFDRVIVACEPAQKLLKSIDLDSTCVPYYLNLKNKSQVFKNVSEGLIVGAGQAQLRKGLHRFIEIAKKLPNKKFAWIGCIDGIEMNEGSIKIEGPNFLLSDFQIGSEIKKITFVLDLPSNVKFLGLKSQKETFEIISNSECFLMLSSDDPFPLVAIEAKLSNTRVVNLKESGDSYKVCNSEDLVLENYDFDKIVQYLENISNNKKYLNLNLINQIENNLSVNRKQYLSFLNRKMKVFLAIDSNSEKFSYDLLRKSIVSLKKFDYEIKVVTDKMTDDLLDVSEVCEIIIFDSEITKHIRVHFENYKQVAGGYYTLEISKICIERNYTDKFVVYCDYDIICNRKFDYLLPFYTEYLAASPEWEKQNSTYFNSGIVLFNVKNTFSRYEIIKNLVLNNEFLEFHDQSILNEVFKGYFTQLDNRMNWKPYWGITADFHIIHYHWLKPHMDIESKDILEKIKNIGNNILDHQSIRYFMQFWRKK